MANYDFDVFISYTREGPVRQWVEELFEQFLRHYLSFELDDDPRVFRDETKIRPGNPWRDTLASALVGSKCLVPIYTPPYFRSAWCKAEWQCFLQRERQTQRALIVPVQWHDSTLFPEEAKLTEMADFRQFAFVGTAFRQTASFVDFQAKMKEFCRDLATILAAAPARDPNWEVTFPEKDLVERPVIRRPVLRDTPDHA